MAQPVDNRDQHADIGGVARPHFRTDRPALAIDDDADDHLVEVGTVILRMTTGTLE